MNGRKRFLIGFVALAVISILIIMTGCVPIVIGGRDAIVGSSEIETREFDFEDFTHVEAGYAFEVDIVRADTYTVTITMNENLFEYLDISRRGSTLVIRLASNYNYSNITHKASITMPELGGLRLSGASRGRVIGFSSSDSVEFALSGASSLNIEDIVAGDTRFDVSGASRITGEIAIDDGDFNVSGASSVQLTGSATDVTLGFSGASSARLASFPVAKAAVHLSGASSADIEVSDELDIVISGASRLVYSGDPTLGAINVSGGSTLHHR